MIMRPIITSIFCVLLIFLVSTSWSQSVEMRFKKIESTLLDSANLEMAYNQILELLADSSDSMTANQLANTYIFGGLSQTDLGNYRLADSLLSLAYSEIYRSNSIPDSTRISAFTRSIYLNLLQGNIKEADEIFLSAYEIISQTNDTLNKPFVKILMQHGIHLSNQFKVNASLKTLDRAINILHKMPMHDSLMLYDLITARIGADIVNRDNESTYKQLDKIITFSRRYPVRGRGLRARALLLLSNKQFNYKLDFNGAIESLQEVEHLARDYYPNTHPLLARIYTQYLEIYSSIGDVDRAIKYNAQANYVLSFIPKKVSTQIRNNRQIADSYYNAMMYGKAAAKYKQILKFNAKYHDRLSNKSLYLRFADIYLKYNDLDSAKIFIDKAQERYLIEGVQHGFMYGEINALYGSYYLKIKDYSRAIEYYSNTVDDYRAKFKPDNKLFGKGNYNLAKAYFYDNQLKKADSLLNEALAIFRLDENIQNETINPSNHQELIYALSLKGAVKHRMSQQDSTKSHLYESMESYDLSVRFIKELRRFMNSQKTRRVLGDLYFDVFNGAIKTAIAIHEQYPSQSTIEKLYSLIQTSKAQALLENIYKSKNIQFAGVPDSLLNKERNIQNRIALLERSLEKYPYRREEYLKYLFESSIDLNDLLSIFQSTYPSYYNLKYNMSTVMVEEAKKTLKTDESLIEYFISDSLIYGIVIDKVQATFYTLSNIESTRQAVDNMRHGISNYQLSSEKSQDYFLETKQLYTRAAIYLNDNLLLPLQGLKSNLIIIPDGILGYVPFEALLYEKPEITTSYGQYPYIINRYQIAYQYSSALWHNRNIKRRVNNKLLAFAPKFNSDGNYDIAAVRSGELMPLTSNIEEVETIGKYYRGEVLTGDRATRKAFSKLAPEFGIIHFATHAIIDNKNVNKSFLALASDTTVDDLSNLYISDLYNTRLPSELVVLSACETGLGEIQRGEGIISLARGFAYAGAASVVTSLWSVSDQATTELISSFYQNLKSGNTKDQALRDAKLDYINSQDDAFAAPFYWAPTIAIGNMQPLSKGFNFWWIVAVIGVALLFLILLKLFAKLSKAKPQ